VPPRLPNRDAIALALAASVGGMPKFEEALERPLLEGLTSWEIRVLIALAKHLKRQDWAANVVVSHLGGDLELLSSRGALGHPKHISGNGVVPGLTDWEYNFHGVGCRLTNRLSGEAIDVDFVDGDGKNVDPFFYTDYLRTVDSPEYPEAKLKKPPECEDAWRVDIASLKEKSWLFSSGHRLVLSREGRELLNLVGPLVEKINDSGTSNIQRALLLCSLGDVVAGVDLVGEACPPGVLVRRREAKERRQEVMMGRAKGDSRQASYAIQALNELDPDGFDEFLCRHLIDNQGNGSGTAAAELLTARNTPAGLQLVEQSVADLTERNNPASYCRIKCCEMILRGYRTCELPKSLKGRLEKLLCSCEEAYAGEAGLLLYALDQSLGAHKLAEGLSSSIPAAQTDAASALAVVGDKVAAEVLLRAAAGGPAIRVARIALAEFPDPAVRDEAKKLGYFRELVAGIPDTGPPYTMEQIADYNRAHWLRAEIRDMREKYGVLFKNGN